MVHYKICPDGKSRNACLSLTLSATLHSVEIALVRCPLCKCHNAKLRYSSISSRKPSCCCCRAQVKMMPFQPGSAPGTPWRAQGGIWKILFTDLHQWQLSLALCRVTHQVGHILSIQSLCNIIVLKREFGANLMCHPA